MINAIKDSKRHVVLVGEPGSSQKELGRLIHRISHRRHHEFYPLPEQPRLDNTTLHALGAIKGGTVFIQLHKKGRLNQRVVAALARPRAALRLIISSPSVDKAEASFPLELVSDAKKAYLPCIRERQDDIPELFNNWFIHQDSRLRIAKLRPELRNALLAYSWPGNLNELNEFAEHLCQLAQIRSARSERQVARESNVSRSKRRSWSECLGVKIELPLIPEEVDS
jgi:hypothetical protein